MKKYILILVGSVFISSCTDVDDVPKDCKCNRVVEVSNHTLPDRTSFGSYITINDCTGIQRQSTWRYSINRPKVGDCK